MKIEKGLVTEIEDKFRGLKLHNGFKIIRTNFDKRRVEVTYKHKDKDVDINMEMKFFIPRFFLGSEDPIEDIGTLNDICSNLKIHDSYELQLLNIGREKIRAEFYNREDATSIQVTTLR